MIVDIPTNKWPLIQTFMHNLVEEQRGNGANQRHFIYFSATARCATFSSSRQWRGAARNGASAQHCCIDWVKAFRFKILKMRELASCYLFAIL